MLLGKVTGSPWSTREDEKLNDWRFMIVSILNQEDEEQGFLIAADDTGAGVGNKVLISRDSVARISTEDPNVPVDVMIIDVISSATEE